MGIDATFSVKSINNITAVGNDYRRKLEIDVSDIEIAESVKPDEIVNEYSEDELLHAIGEKSVIDWLEEKGYTVTE